MLNALGKLKRAVLAPEEEEEGQEQAALSRQPQQALARQEATNKSSGPFDGIDLIALLLGGGALHEYGIPLFMMLAVAQYIARRVPSTAAWLAEAVFGTGYETNPEAYRLFPGMPQPAGLLPAPEEGASSPSERAARSTARVLVTPTPVAASQATAQVPDGPKEVLEARPVVQADGSVVWTTETAISALPALVQLDELTQPDSATAVPLGVNHLGAPVWADLMVDLLHVGIYGTSGAGKDTLLRVWFSTVATRNRPEDVQWAFLDGKGDWLTPDLADLACMFVPPAGGYGQKGKEAILKASKAVDKEAERRQGLIFPNGCRTREQYNKMAVQKGWEPIPLLIVVASDVMDSVAGEVEDLLASLVSKARALGIRVVASMQTPTGKSMEWRMNLSSVLAGALVDGTQDAPALGVREVKDLPFRPSKVPPPPKVKGVFVGKVRGEFMVLRTPIFLADSEASEERFNQIVAGLPKKGSQASVKPSEGLTADERAWLSEMEARYGSVNRSAAESGFPAGVVSAEGVSGGKQFPAQLNATFRTSQNIPQGALEAVNLWKSADAETRKLALKTLHLMAAGTGKQAAIELVFGASSGRPYQRASAIVEAARLLQGLSRHQ